MAPVSNGEPTMEPKTPSHDSDNRSSKKISVFLGRRESTLSVGPWSKSELQNGDKSRSVTPEPSKNVVELLLEGDSSRLIKNYPAFQTINSQVILTYHFTETRSNFRPAVFSALLP